MKIKWTAVSEDLSVGNLAGQLEVSNFCDEPLTEDDLQQAVEGAVLMRFDIKWEVVDEPPVTNRAKESL